MSVETDLARYAIGLIEDRDLPHVAADWMSSGSDTPSVEALAHAIYAAPAQLRELYRQSAEELGYRLPSHRQAGMILARSIAREVLDRRIAPYDGAKRIWTEIHLRLPMLTELLPFVGLAGACEDDPAHAAIYAEQIVRHCRGLIELGDPDLHLQAG